jgi:two-component system, OmpR family, heavy metal sensor histidine kinase CusS
MWLKNVHSESTAWRRRLRVPWSITARLTALYTASAFLILSAVTAYLYVTLEQYLTRKDTLAVRDQVILLRHMLREVTDPTVPLSKARKWEERGVDNKRFQSRILDDAAHVLAESPHIVPPPHAFPLATPAEAPLTGTRWTAPDGSAYILMAAWGNSGRAPEQGKVIQVAFERSTSMALLEDFRETLLVSLVVGLLLTAIVARWVSRRAMQPLREVAAAARRITANQLHERIERARWPAELKELGAAFDDMLQRLEESFRRLSQFSSDLAHELRTPIGNLVGEAEVAISQARTADEYRAVVESSLEEYQRLARMIDSLLFLARADAPESHIDAMDLDVQKELDGLRDFYGALADERGIALECSAPVTIRADPILFRRALSNLIGNAVRYTSAGGSITVRARPADHGAVQIVVDDTGSGITPQDLPRIFDRFFRADPARSNHDGAGLGLAIVKSIMLLHGGAVTASSTPGRGTEVTLTFPVTAGKSNVTVVSVPVPA